MKHREYIVLSVESRKGGVGKTIAALNIARLLLKNEKFEVIFLDLDMSGTEASKIVPSLEMQNIWKNRIYVVNNRENTRDLNIVGLFEDYMAGEDIPDIHWEKELQSKNNKGFTLASGKINIFSSFIKRTNHFSSEPGHFYGPAVLFDEIHSLWFIGMIKDLIIKSSHSLPPGKQLVVIIDNAPGYSGLEPAIEDWLTDLGPHLGKFLFVSTVDTQDLYSCIKSLMEINQIYIMKWEASRKFLSMAVNKNEESLESAHEVFFNKLAETYINCEGKKRKSPECNECGFCFYRSLSPDKGEMFQQNPQRFLAILLNKIPETVYHGKYTIKIGDLLKKLDIQIDDNVTLDSLEQSVAMNHDASFPKIFQVIILLKSNRIPFKPEWSLQYCIDRLLKDSKFSSALSDDEYYRMEQIVRTLKHTTLPKFELFSIPEEKTIKAKTQCIETFDKSIVTALGDLSVVLDRHYQNFFDEFALLRSPYKSLFRALNRMPLDLIKPEFGEDSIQFLKPMKYEKISNIFKKIKENFDIYKDIFRRIPENSGLPNEFSLSQRFSIFEILKKIEIDLVTDLAIGHYLSVNDGLNPNFQEKFLENYRFITTIIVLDLISDIDRLNNPNILYQKKYWNERKKRPVDSLKRIITIFKKSHFFKDIEYKDDQILEINRRICSLKIRQFDAEEDFHFISECIEIISKEDSPANFGAIQNLLRKVVLEKRIAHFEGLQILSDFQRQNRSSEEIDFFRFTDELAEYNEVLSSILGNSQWALM